MITIIYYSIAKAQVFIRYCMQCMQASALNYKFMMKGISLIEP